MMLYYYRIEINEYNVKVIFILEIGCVNLRTPVNGAKACDLWKLGRQCQIQCHERFDFSFRFPEVYVCANSTGLWKPHGIVPDCTRKLIVV